MEGVGEVRLIDSDALNECTANFRCGLHGVRREAVEKIFEYIDKAPAIDCTPVKRGEWRKTVGGYKTCSECGAEHPNVDMRGFYVQDTFCPNCGAEMCGKKDAPCS